MRLITTPEKLNKVFIRLCEEYKEYYWLTYNLDIKFSHPEKIRLLVTQCICGVDEHERNNQHDNSWEPIATYYNDNCGHSFFWIRGRFISEDSEEKSKFHSKVYFFRKKEDNENEWKVIIGSSNLTARGFEMIQSSVLLGNEDDSDGTLYDQIIELISKKWADNVYLTDYKSRINNKRNYKNWKRQFETKFKDRLVHYSYLNSNNTQIKVEALPLPD